MPDYCKFAIIGAGNWGTALACVVARSTNSDVLLYTAEKAVMDEINSSRTNYRHLNNVPLPGNIKATNKIEEISGYNVIIIATPSYSLESVVGEIAKISFSEQPIILVATKGLCENPICLFSTKIEAILGRSYGFISGPNFAKEAALNNFTAITISSEELDIAKIIASKLSSDKVVTSVSDDIITVQITGIMKNIIAIKSGILIARKEGENARAWLISQGLKEIATLSQKLGGKPGSLTLPAVIGDLVLTSYSTNSRNTRFGIEFHNNNYSKDFLNNYPILVEGVNSARLLTKFISNQELGLDLPILTSISSLL